MVYRHDNWLLASENVKGLFFRVPLTDKIQTQLKKLPDKHVPHQKPLFLRSEEIFEYTCSRISSLWFNQRGSCSPLKEVQYCLPSLGLRWLLPIHLSTHPTSTNGTLGRASPVQYYSRLRIESGATTEQSNSTH